MHNMISTKFFIYLQSYQPEKGISGPHFEVEHLFLHLHKHTSWKTRRQWAISEKSTRSCSETPSLCLFCYSWLRTYRCAEYMTWCCYTSISRSIYTKIRTIISKQDRNFLSACSVVNWYCLLSSKSMKPYLLTDFLVCCHVRQIFVYKMQVDYIHTGYFSKGDSNIISRNKFMHLPEEMVSDNYNWLLTTNYPVFFVVKRKS